MRRFSIAQLPVTPWKNGGGTTREIASVPAEAGLDGFTWRASIANVSSDGPFSTFPGVDRVIVLLEGEGVVLQAPDGRMVRRLDQAFDPFAFSGDEEITSQLIGGPSVDFNVMTRRNQATATVRVVRADDELRISETGIVFAARGQWRVGWLGGDELRLQQGEGCWWERDANVGRAIADSPDGVLLAVEIRKR